MIEDELKQYIIGVIREKTLSSIKAFSKPLEDKLSYYLGKTVESKVSYADVNETLKALSLIEEKGFDIKYEDVLTVVKLTLYIEDGDPDVMVYYYIVADDGDKLYQIGVSEYDCSIISLRVSMGIEKMMKTVMEKISDIKTGGIDKERLHELLREILEDIL